MKKKLKKIGILLAFLFFVFALGMFYLLANRFALPDSVKNPLTHLAKEYYGVDFYINDFIIDLPANEVLISSFSMAVADKKPYITFGETSVKIGSGTSVYGIINNNAAVDKIVINDLKLDLLAPKLSEASGAFELPIIPASEIVLNGFSFNTNYGVFDLSSNTASLRNNSDYAEFSLNVPNGPFDVEFYLNSGIDLNSRIASISMAVSHKNIADCSPLGFFASSKNVMIESGLLNVKLNYIGNIIDRINKPLEDISSFFNKEISGKISIDNTTFSWNGICFNGNLSAERESELPWKYNIETMLGGGKIKINGELPVKNDCLSDFSANMLAEKVLLDKKLLQRLGMPSDVDYMPGRIGLKGKINSNNSTISGSGTFSADNWSFWDKKLNKATINWKLGDDYSILATGVFDTHWGNLSASSTIWLEGEKKHKGILTGFVKDIELQEFSSFVNMPIKGKCSGTFTLELDFENPLNSFYGLDISMEDGEFYSFNAKHIDASVSGSGDNWRIKNPHLYFKNNGEMDIKGFVSNKDLDVKIDVKNLELSNFGFGQDIASGVIHLEAVGKGNLDNPTIMGKFWTEHFSIMGIPIESIKTEFNIKDNLLVLTPLVISPIDGSIVDGYCTIDLKNQKVLNGQINFQQFCLEMLKSLLPGDLANKELDGIASGYFFYNLKNDNSIWKANIDVRDLVLLGQEIDSVYIEGNGYNKEAELKHLFIRGFGGSIDLSGNFVDYDKFSGSLKGEGLNLNRIDILKLSIPTIQGGLDFQGDIDWVGNRRKGNFTVFASNLKTDTRDLGNFGGEIIIDNNKLEIKNGDFDRLGIKIGGDLQWKEDLPYSFKLNLDKVDFSFIPQSHGMKAFENGSILINGSCLVKGKARSQLPDLVDLSLESIKIQKDDAIIVSNKPVNILLENGDFNIKSLELKYKLGILSIEGQIASNGELSFFVKGDNFSAKALGALLGAKGFEYDGDVFFTTKVIGNVDDPKFTSIAVIDNFILAGKSIDKIKAKLEGSKSMLNIDDTFIKLKNTSFDLKGQVALNNFIPEELDLKLSIPEGPITDLSFYLPEFIKTAEGRLTAALILLGNPSSPKIIGDLNLSAKKIELTKMKKAFTDVVFDITTDDLITTVNTLKASMGKGSVNGYGTIDFKNALGKVDIHVKTEKLDLPFHSVDISNASGTLDILGDIYNPDISGYLYIPKGKVALNSGLIPENTNTKPIFETLKYRFEVEIPRKFWVKNSFLNAELKGKVSVVGDLDNFALDGNISTVQGKIFFKQHQFKIQNGDIRFGGVDNSLDPYVYVKSEGQVGSHKIFLTLSGNISNFKPQVYSTPPMSEGDIIALLTLGMDLNSAKNSDTKELFEDEVLEGLKNSYISSLIGESLGNALNLDELYLTSGMDKESGKTQSYVRVGKYLSDRVFMAYEGTMSDDRNESYNFEYRLPRGLVFSVEFKEPESSQTYGFRYDWQFW